MKWNPSPSDRGRSCNRDDLKWFHWIFLSWLFEWEVKVVFYCCCFHLSGLTFLEPDHTGPGLKSLRKGQTPDSLQGGPFEGWMAVTRVCEDVLLCVWVWSLAVMLLCPFLCDWLKNKKNADIQGCGGRLIRSKWWLLYFFMGDFVSSTLIVSNFNPPIEVHSLCFIFPPQGAPGLLRRHLHSPPCAMHSMALPCGR